MSVLFLQVNPVSLVFLMFDVLPKFPVILKFSSSLKFPHVPACVPHVE